MPDLTPEQQNIEDEVASWAQAEPLRAIANYAIKVLEAQHRRNVQELPAGAGSSVRFRAIRGLQPLAPFAASPLPAELRAYMHEPEVAAAATGAVLRSSPNLAVYHGATQRVTLTRTGTRLQATGLTTPRPPANRTCYLSLRKRPDTTGLRALQTVLQAEAAQLTAAVLEPTVLTARRAERLWSGAPVEWPVVSGTEARVLRNATQAPYLTLVDPDVAFTGLVQVNDWVTLVARTRSPQTEPAAVAGVYKVRQVGLESVVLEGVRYTRTSEGVFEPSTDPVPVSVDTRVDWAVTRSRAAGFYLRDPLQTFSQVRANDWLHLSEGTWAGTYQVRAVLAPGLLELGGVRHTGSGAPYAAQSGTPATGEELKPLYRLTRTQSPSMQTFQLRVPGAALAAVRADDVVELAVRSGPLEPTTLPTVTPGYFRVLAVAGDRLTLDNRRLTRASNRFTSTDTYVYQSFVDWAGLTVWREGATYPYAAAEAGEELLFEVLPREADDAADMWRLSLQRPLTSYDEDTLTLRASTGAPLPDDAFTDAVDARMLVAYGPSVALAHTAAALAGVQGGDFVHVTRRAGDPSGGAVPNRINHAVLRVAPREPGLAHLVLLERTLYKGLDLDETPTQYAPYTADTALQDNRWWTAVAYRAVRVPPASEATYDRVVLVGLGAGAYEAVAPGDWFVLNATSSAQSRTALSADQRQLLGRQFWQVLSKAQVGTQRVVTLQPTSASYVSSEREALATQTAVSLADLAAPTPVMARRAGAFKVSVSARGLRRAPFTTYVQLANLVAVPAPGDLFRFTYGTTPAVFVAINTGQATPGRVRLNPVAVTALPDDRFAIETANQLTLDVPDAAVDRTTLQWLRVTNQLVRVQAYLEAYTRVYQARGEAARLAEARGAVEALFSPKLDAATQLTLLATALRQVLELAPDLGVTYGGFADGQATRLPGTAVTGATLAATLLDASQARSNAAWRDHSTVQATVALLADADLSAYLQLRTPQDLKDLYVQARLQALGYASELQLAGVASSAQPPAARESQRAVLAFQQRAAQLVREAARKALVAQQRPDIPALVDARLAQLLPLVRQALPDPAAGVSAHKDVFYVRSTALDRAQLGTVLPLLGDSVLNALAAGRPRDHRMALAMLIPVTPEPGNRRLSLQVVRARQGRLYENLRATDLERHLAQTTDPVLRQRLQEAAAKSRARERDKREKETAGENAITRRNGPAPLPTAERPAPSGDMAAAEQQAARGVLPPELAAIPRPPAPVVATLVSADTTALPAAPAAARATVPLTGSARTVTSLLSGDRGRPDFRRLGIALPYRVLNASSQADSGPNLATISLCNEDLSAQHAFPIDLGHDYGALYDNGGQYRYNQFILTGVQEVHSEKFQIVDTLSDGFITFAFGEKPEVWSISGVLINDVVSDQVGKFRHLFHEYLRVSVLAQQRRKMVITVPAIGYQMFGYAVAFAPQHSSENETVVPFTLQFIKTDVRPLPFFKVYGSKSLPMSGFLQKLAEQVHPTPAEDPRATKPPAPGAGAKAVQKAQADGLPGLAQEAAAVVERGRAFGTQLTQQVAGFFAGLNPFAGRG
jgi:hypothetical protein